MHASPSILAAPALVIAFLAGPSALGAQDPVIKPTTTTTTSVQRLPAPAKFSAVQQPDGRIRVVWAAVEGAASYALYRSVPNVGQGLVALPNPADTTFLDADVKAGFFYYYVVNAVSSGGGVGMKATTSPVNSTITVTGGTTTTTTTTSATGIAPPSEARAWAGPYPYADIAYRSTQSGVRFLIERGVVSSAGTAFTSLGIKACCRTFDPNVGNTFSPGTRLVYRITAVDSATTRRSTPVLTNEITTFRLEADVGGSVRTAIKAGQATGGSIGFYGGTPQRDWTNRRIASLDPTILQASADGLVTPIAVGSGYVVIIGTRSDGVQQAIVYRVDVEQLP